MKRIKNLFIIIYLLIGGIQFSNGQNAFNIDTILCDFANYDSNGNAFIVGYKGIHSYLIKLDAQNNLEWSKETTTDKQLSIHMMLGNDVYLTGTNISDGNVKYLTKINTSGVQSWTKTITTDAHPFNFINTPVIINTSQNIGIFFATSNSIIIDIISPSGSNLWQKEIPKHAPFVSAGLIGTSDNSGNIYIAYQFEHSIYLLKLDQYGNLLFHKEYNNSNYNYFTSKMTIVNNNILIFGQISDLTFTTSPIVIKMDFSGNLTEVIKADFPYNTQCRDFLVDNKDVYFIGSNYDPGNFDDPFIAKTDTTFNSMNIITSGNATEAYYIRKYQNEFLLTTNGFISKFDNGLKFHCDTLHSNISFSSLPLLTLVQSYSQISNASPLSNSTLVLTNIQLSSYQNCIPTSVIENQMIESISIYPNPTSSFFILEFEGETKNLNYSIHDILGKEIFSGEINSTQTSINCENWSSGVYLIKIGDADGYRVEKIIIEK